MKKVTLMLFAGMLLMSCNASAQSNNNSEPENQRRGRTENRWTPERRAEAMAEELNLTDAEKAQVEALFKKQDEKRTAQIEEQRARRESAREDREARRAEMQKLREKEIAEQHAELEKIIGKEKADQWQKSREDFRRSNRESNREGRRSSGRNR